MQTQRITRKDGVKRGCVRGWERPRCCAPPASAPPRWSLPPPARHVPAHVPTVDQIVSGVSTGLDRSEYLIQSRLVLVQVRNAYLHSTEANPAQAASTAREESTNE